MTLRSLGLALLTYVGGVQSVTADEWVVGIGGADLLDNTRKEAVAVLLEVHSDPFHRQSWAELSWMGTVKLDTTQNHFLGVGVHALAPLSERAFLEASLAVGGYHQGTYIGKEADDVLFRSSIGGGFELESGNRLSLTIDHLLDHSFKNQNPGKESILLRYTWAF
ncbi:acyloxyacyl hydrolase [Sulfitobacter sp. S0837]|uniref:acyloxyacyl hydrolase n=1 Tax=Sulfitobacter maritimus TaxID=2741719 RepID=UPI00158183E5|nr:acyloxyacyl hydrolase [Sulfitobacter maritimus]NUH66356.1 acyloxyacyl hydrolase [Sulfitobacter maritimus]